MKTKAFMALAIVIASYGSVSAINAKTILNEDPSKTITIKQMDNLKFRVSITEKKTAMASIRITDERGNEIYYDYLLVNKFNNKLYDLSNLTDGTYTFTIKTDEKLEKQKVYISTQINRSALVAMN